jgi:hypothetical protein
MKNYAVIAQWHKEEFEELFFMIRQAIHKIHQQKLSEDGIRINIPKYVVELAQKYDQIYRSSPLEYEEGKTEMFGCPVYPSFDNYVVVFHVDMPIHGDTNYQIIDLKLIKPYK